ncbi:MAG TPA: NADPH-dependent F420 reductase [Pseudonocardiaceae bacterium]|nr:NADPH-dependent F420 reductase [Pseudonocardiaceae bacterium]
MTQADLFQLTIGVLGGTGPQGRGLAYRWALRGLSVVIGSREVGRAEQTAASLRERAGSQRVRGADNVDCAAEADLVLVAVPFDGHAAFITSLRAPLAGKIVIDCVNPLGFDSRGPYPLDVPPGSAAEQAEALLPESRVTAAFHHVSAVLLDDPEVSRVDTDVLVLGDDRAATDQVRALADAIPGVRGIYGGRLRNARQVEALTANLIAINRRHHTHAGIRITGV